MVETVYEAFPEIAEQVFAQAYAVTGVDLRSAVAGTGAPSAPAGAADHQAAVYTVSLITHLGLLESD